MEIWKTYKKNPRYEVSDDGDIRNAKTGRILRASVDERGYKRVSLYSDDGRACTKKVGRIVAETFHGGAHDDLDAIYIDGNNSNTRADNMRWAARNEQHDRRISSRKKVRCKETGIEYESVLACSKATGINISSISKSANGSKINISGGYSFEFI